jgi:hypothetical protein
MRKELKSTNYNATPMILGKGGIFFSEETIFAY